MGFAVFTFFVIFLLIASGGLLLFYREAMLQRISAVVTPRAKQAGGLYGRLQRRVSVGGVVQQFQRVLPRSQAEVSVAQQRLIRAGYRNDSTVNVFYGAKVLVPLALFLLVMVSGLASYNPFFVYALALGWDFWRRIFGWGERSPNGRRVFGAACRMCSICW